MKTLTLKNKFGRIITVEYKHGLELMKNEQLELVVEEPKKIIKEAVIEETIKEPIEETKKTVIRK